MKLYTKDERVIPNYTMEQFNFHYQNSAIVSQEALSDYFYKVKDAFATGYNRLISDIEDKATNDVLTKKFETLHKIKRLDFINIGEHVTSKPENFSGYFIDYTNDLLSISKEMNSKIDNTLDSLAMAISGFINEYTENKVVSLYGLTFFKESDKLIEKNSRFLAKYYPNKNEGTKARIKEVIKTFNDIEKLYQNVVSLDAVVNTTRVNGIARKVENIKGLVDVLLEENAKTGTLVRNNTVKKDLVYAIHVCAREVEFYSYLYSNILFFHGSFKNLIDELHNLADMKPSK